MPNLVNKFLLGEFEKEFNGMGSCIVLNFDKITVQQINDIRNQFRDAGVQYLVVKNRLALKAFDSMGLDLSAAFKGKCGVVIAEEEKAISAAKIVRDFTKKSKKKPILVTGGVIEGEAITGPAAAAIADMPDKQTVRGMLASVVAGPARSVAGCVQGVAGGLARVLQARIDKEGDAV